VRRGPEGASWIAFPPALLLASLACFAISPVKETPRVATEASEIRAEFPHLFGRNRFEAEPRSKSSVVESAVLSRQESTLPLGLDPISAVQRGAQEADRGVRGRCERSSSGLCYDLAERHIVYPSARQYMPKLDGLTAESVSLRRNAIRFKYSFP
jgi:hypothetical protein